MMLAAPALASWFSGCAYQPLPVPIEDEIDERLDALLPTDILLLGERHDAPEHQRIHRAATASLASRYLLGALALEMVDQGATTAGLPTNASEAEVMGMLRWKDQAWAWKLYGPAVMEAVRAGVPVLGANLPSSRIRQAMADTSLDALLPGPLFAAQQAAIQTGHCDLLPASQIIPMTRVQIARDRAMAETLAGAVVRGKTVLLLAGGGHVDRTLGVPHYLPPRLKVRAVQLKTDDTPHMPAGAKFDADWPTTPGPAKDYCAELRESLGPRAAPKPAAPASATP